MDKTQTTPFTQMPGIGQQLTYPLDYPTQQIIAQAVSDFLSSSAGSSLVAGSSTGDMKILAHTTIPTGWLECDGSSQLIATFPALSALIRTYFGGVDGTHFYLPDMRRSVPMGAGGTVPPGAIVSANTVGSKGGEEFHQLTISELAAHHHSVAIQSGSSGNMAGGNVFNTGGTTGDTGNDSPHNNVQPSLVLTYIIKT